MCEHDSKQALARSAAPPGSAVGRIRPNARRHLWELPVNSHCPVIGACAPLGLLRRLVNKGVRGKALADDYELHVGAVGECGSRNRVSELLHAALALRLRGAAPLQGRARRRRGHGAVAGSGAGGRCGGCVLGCAHPSAQ